MNSLATEYAQAPRAVAREENRLRLAALEPAPPLETYAGWARVLELSLVFAALHDAVLRLGHKTIGEVDKDFARVDQLTRSISQLDPRVIIGQNRELLAPVATLNVRPDDPATCSTEAMVREVKSLLLHCPMGEIESAARGHGIAEIAHRCRLAFDGLKAFVARHESPEQRAIAAAARMYIEGRASIDEIAAMLDRDVPDVVALLEEGGYRRSVEQIRLSDDERAAKLRLVRADRLARGGEPKSTASDVVRDVTASQRIEGVDARPWLRS